MTDLENKVSLLNGGPMPSLPTSWDKAVPKIIILVGLMFGGAGAAYSEQVAKDPETQEVVGTKYNIGAIMTAVAGLLATIGASLYQSNNTTKAENAADHIATSAVAAVSEAAKANPVDSNGNASLEHSLTMAVVQAAQEGRLKDAGKVLSLIGDLEEGGDPRGPAESRPLLSPEEAA